jgi:hypothetical protein
VSPEENNKQKERDETTVETICAIHKNHRKKETISPQIHSEITNDTATENECES